MATATVTRPATLAELRESGWVSKSVKREIYDNFMQALSQGEDLFPGIIGYEDTVIPEINIGLIAGHDLLFLGEKGTGQEPPDAADRPVSRSGTAIPRYPRVSGA